MLRIDIGQRGQIDDGPPAGAGPHAGPDVHVRESGGAFHEGNGLAAQHADEHIHHAARTHQGRGRGKHLLHNTHDDNRGNKVRSIGNNLYRFLELRAAQLVHHQRQQQAAGKFGQQRVKAQADGVADNLQRIGRAQEALKVLEHIHLAAGGSPRATPDALGRLEIFKGNLHAQHRPIVE